MSWFSYEDLQVFCELLFDCGVDRGGEMSLLWLFFFCLGGEVIEFGGVFLCFGKEFGYALRFERGALLFC